MSRQQFFAKKPSQKPKVTEEEMMERERIEKAGQRNFVIFIGILILAGLGFALFYVRFS